MKRSAKAVSAPVRTRRWRVPPPLTRGGELLEGAELLQELSGETSVLLWKSLRTVTLWASASGREQAELFSAGAERRRMAEILAVELDPALAEPLRVLAGVLGAPATARREPLALACRQIAQWAQARSLGATALAFTQAAALLCPGDAGIAYQVGKLARRLGESARAESWHRRAIMLGRQSGAWEAYARSYVSLGNLAVQRGNFPMARRCQLKAFRAARRHGLGEVQAMALHDLFAISVETESAATAQRYAEQAFRAYGSGHPNVRYLAHDVCTLWMREGQFGRALPVLQALLPHFPESERLLIAANVARAAGGAANREAFESAWSQAAVLLERQQTRGATTRALLNLARGASAIGEWDRALEMAERAHSLAVDGGESQIVFATEALLDSVRSRRAVETVAPRAAHDPEEQRADSFAENLLCAFSTGGVG